MTRSNIALLDVALPASPPYVPVMRCLPVEAKLVVHVAFFVFPEPVRGTDPHPLIGVVPSVNATVPVGLEPVTEAVKVRP